MQKKFVAGVASVAALFAAQVAVPAFAQLNAAQRHPTITGIAAGEATHHALKVSARHKKARHQRLSFAERHPTLSAIGAAAGTHHLLKASAHKKGY